MQKQRHCCTGLTGRPGCTPDKLANVYNPANDCRQFPAWFHKEQNRNQLSFSRHRVRYELYLPA
jgi:hypothetical protein